MIFSGEARTIIGKIHPIPFDPHEQTDSRKFSIHWIYRFNNYKKKVFPRAVEEGLQKLP